MLRYTKAKSLLEVIGTTFFVESKVLLGLGIPLVSGWWWPIYGVSWESGEGLLLETCSQGSGSSGYSEQSTPYSITSPLFEPFHGTLTD